MLVPEDTDNIVVVLDLWRYNVVETYNDALLLD